MRLFVVVWWAGGQRKLPESSPGTIEWITPPTPYGAIFTNEEAAKAAASVRNAVLIVVQSSSMPKVLGADYYRRDDEGTPIPIEWRDIGDPRSKGPCGIAS